MSISYHTMAFSHLTKYSHKFTREWNCTVLWAPISISTQSPRVNNNTMEGVQGHKPPPVDTTPRRLSYHITNTFGMGDAEAAKFQPLSSSSPLSKLPEPTFEVDKKSFQYLRSLSSASSTSPMSTPTSSGYPSSLRSSSLATNLPTIIEQQTINNLFSPRDCQPAVTATIIHPEVEVKSSKCWSCCSIM